MFNYLQALLERTGYTLDVTTGQRKYGGPPPDSVYSGVQPGIGTEVSVLQLFAEIFPVCKLFCLLFDGGKYLIIFKVQLLLFFGYPAVFCCHHKQGESCDWQIPKYFLKGMRSSWNWLLKPYNQQHTILGAWVEGIREKQLLCFCFVMSVIWNSACPPSLTPSPSHRRYSVLTERFIDGGGLHKGRMWNQTKGWSIREQRSTSSSLCAFIKVSSYAFMLACSSPLNAEN